MEFSVQLSLISGARVRLKPSMMRITITDDDTPPSRSNSDISIYQIIF